MIKAIMLRDSKKITVGCNNKSSASHWLFVKKTHITSIKVEFACNSDDVFDFHNLSRRNK